MDRVLGVFAKEPQAGGVKTRLAATFGPRLAAQLYEAFLRDLLARLESLPMKLVLAYTPASGRMYFERWANGRFTIEEQTGADLGARMANFFQRQFERGADRVVLIGSDSPDLPTSRIEQAFVQLDRSDLVFGPSTDGGYYLVGMSRFIPGVFEGIDWSTERVFEQSMRRLGQLGLR